MTWNRFKELYYQDAALGVALDISRIPFPDGYLASMEPASRPRSPQMAALEKGAIANPSEKRMVGHYWLRAPELAPTKEITEEITTRPWPRSRTSRPGPRRGDRGPGGKFTHLLVIGIGGSALGPQFVSHALGQPGRTG
jgi:glucose-6-phosphate isomerase